MKIVFTGGTYAGKTTLLKLFRKEGFVTLPDAGSEIIEELNKKIGIDQQKKFRAKYPIEYYSKIIRRQIENEAKIKSDITILDRGVQDYVTMLGMTKTKVPKGLKELVNKHYYDFIFVFETLSRFNQRKKSGRSIDKKDSVKLGKLLFREYKKMNANVFIVKEAPIKERYKFVRDVTGI